MRKEYAKSLPASWQNVAEVFEALGDPQRQRILLLFEPGERLNAGQISESSTLSRSTVSHHLKVLRESGVLRSEKIGKEVWYWVDRNWLLSTLGRVVDYITRFT